MDYRVVSDSSSNLLQMDDERYAVAPLHIFADGKEWPDVPSTDLDAMIDAIYASKQKNSTSCPSPEEWISGFGDAENVFCITITNTLSGSYNSAMVAKEMYESEHPDRHVYVIDSLATGPRMVMIIRHLMSILDQGVSAEEAVANVEKYRDSIELFFTLENVRNFVDSGRLNPLLAKAIGLLGMRFTGRANAEGKIQVVGKTRGASKTIKYLVDEFGNYGYNGGLVMISHVQNLPAAEALADGLREKYGKDIPIEIMKNTALCSYYAEKGGMIIGFEREPAPVPESLMGTLKHKLGAVIGTAKEKMPASVTEMEETVKEKYAAAKEKMPTSVGEVEELVKEKYAAAKEKMPTSVGEVEELVKEKYAAAKEKMPSSVGEVEELVKGTYAAAKEKIPTAAEVKEKLEEVREKIQDYKGE